MSDDDAKRPGSTRSQSPPPKRNKNQEPPRPVDGEADGGPHGEVVLGGQEEEEEADLAPAAPSIATASTAEPAVPSAATARVFEAPYEYVDFQTAKKRLLDAHVEKEAAREAVKALKSERVDAFVENEHRERMRWNVHCAVESGCLGAPVGAGEQMGAAAPAGPPAESSLEAQPHTAPSVPISLLPSVSADTTTTDSTRGREGHRAGAVQPQQHAAQEGGPAAEGPRADRRPVFDMLIQLFLLIRTRLDLLRQRLEAVLVGERLEMMTRVFDDLQARVQRVIDMRNEDH